MRLGSYESWSANEQAPVAWAFGVDPGEGRIKVGDALDQDGEILELVVRGVESLIPKGRTFSSRELLKAAQASDDKGQDILEAVEMWAPNRKQTAVTLGYLLSHYRDRICGGKRISHASQGKMAVGRFWKLSSN